MKKFWVSWYNNTSIPFTIHSPWWVSGYTFDENDDEIDIICCAIKAESLFS